MNDYLKKIKIIINEWMKEIIIIIRNGIFFNSLTPIILTIRLD